MGDLRSTRTDLGILSVSRSGIEIQGPGRLDIETGGNIDLGTARGITSLGDTKNAALADTGADITVLAGLNGAEPDYRAFIDRYFVAGDDLPPVLVLKPAVLDAFFNELRESGRAAARDIEENKEPDYSRGFDAIRTLFPGSGYRGALSIFFSRIYTLDGGDIDLVVPGGFINAGLATPPASFGVTKPASELGIVAQSTGGVRAFLNGNFEVNESRVFAADGGDILVWSSRGDIDAGRGAKSSISAPPPVITINPDTGAVDVSFPPALSGSGIRALTSTPGRPFGSVDLIYPVWCGER